MRIYSYTHPLFFRNNKKSIHILHNILTYYNRNKKDLLPNIKKEDFVDITLELIRYLNINFYYSLKTIVAPKEGDGIVFISKDRTVYVYDCYEFGYNNYNELSIMCWFRSLLGGIFDIVNYEEDIDYNEFFYSYSYDSFKTIINHALNFIDKNFDIKY